MTPARLAEIYHRAQWARDMVDCPRRSRMLALIACDDVPALLAYVAELEADRDALLDGLPEAGMWEIPEPGAEVMAVTDSRGVLYRRDQDDADRWLRVTSGRFRDSWRWGELLDDRGRLTDATPALPVTEPEEGRTP